ncbi:thiamine pyrophosphate-binding protein [Methanobrevibacter filiformis]|uniref:Acetolactate synthase large subunit n=1 Tax=Methanobrevibacter filiformis TaxID=55758 RepID=A0A166E2M2_9EURY|nr:thiamine pyrophosphate-binding protein [Methanobrevibacter filiformis]KZX16211.1 acetolactate synthase large subunit [Methanobrevibacter filiformis]
MELDFTMNTSDALVQILEENNVKAIFGHPGEQILPFYKALSTSKIKHILCRNEQGAAIAADSYGRCSGEFGVCLATAGPGALNLFMGIAIAFKDSVPLLFITGDVPKNLKGKDTFQDFDLINIFKNIAIKSFNPHDGKTAILNLKEAIEILKKEPKGPVHLNLPKDVLLDFEIGDVLNKQLSYTPPYDYSNLEIIINRIKSSKKPVILVGAGIKWGKSIELLKELIAKYKVPVVSTYHSKGLFTDCENYLGMVGIRGTYSANNSFKESDLILTFGSKLSERTLNVDNLPLSNIDEIFRKYKSKIIDININKSNLKGSINIHGDVLNVLNVLNNEDNLFKSLDKKWLDNLAIINNDILIDGVNDYSVPLKPQMVINEILKHNQDSFVIGDAGSHTSWTLLSSNPSVKGDLIYSGSVAPMGYAIPGVIGASIAKPNSKIIAIVGDGGIQMNIQELATISQYNLPIAIFLLNNSQLGVIRQWEEVFYDMEQYEVNLENPDFQTIAKGYNIKSMKVSTKNELDQSLDVTKYLDEPVLIEIIVDNEDVSLPKSIA